MLVKMIANASIGRRDYQREDILDLDQEEYDNIKQSCLLPKNDKEKAEWKKLCKNMKDYRAYQDKMIREAEAKEAKEREAVITK